MNKFFIVLAVAAVAVLAYLLLAPKKAHAPEDPPIAGTLSDAQSEQQLDSQTAAAAASMISTSPDNAAVFIMEPGDGSTVTSPITVKFGITGMSVAPAGQNTENSGHHHLLIDLEELPPLNQPLPASDQLIHFGAGQTETTIELEPGTHTLQLLLGNYLHIPHEPPVVSKKITINVE